MNRPQTPGKKEYTPPLWYPPFSVCRPPPRHRAKKSYGVYHFLGKQGKSVYTIGPERRVHKIETSDPEKEKRGFPRWWCILSSLKIREGRILAVWILVAKLPNSALNFAVDFLLLLFSKEKGSKRSTKKIRRKIHPEICPEIFPSDFCRSLTLASFP